MTSALDVDAGVLIQRVAERLEHMKILKPAFVGLVKSGAYAERPPEQTNFWYLRCASVLRQAYASETIGVQRLRRHYGGKKKHSRRPEHHRPAGGSTIRKAMQVLEKHGLLEKTKKGRRITAMGRKLLDAVARETSNGRGTKGIRAAE